MTRARGILQAIDAVEGSPTWKTSGYNLQHSTMECPLQAEPDHELTLVISKAVRGRCWSFAVEDLSSTWDFASGTLSAPCGTAAGFALFETLFDLSHIKSISHHEDTNAVKERQFIGLFPTSSPYREPDKQLGQYLSGATKPSAI